MQPSRRDFVLQSTAAAAALTQTAEGQRNDDTEGWYDRPMRWAQLAFVEDDPGRYNPAFWLDYFKRVHADAACLAPADASRFIPQKFHCITGANFSATPIRSAKCWQAAASWA